MTSYAVHEAESMPGKTRPRRKLGGRPFPQLPFDVALIVAALAAGVFLAQPLKWHQLDHVTGITVWNIFIHNASLAGLAILLTGVGARVMMLLNGLWLGMGLTASVAISGIAHTVGLTAIHVPLEVCAWAMNIELARRFWTLVQDIRRTESGRRKLYMGYMRLVLLTLGVYFIAAVAEWASFGLTGR